MCAMGSCTQRTSLQLSQCIHRFLHSPAPSSNKESLGTKKINKKAKTPKDSAMPCKSCWATQLNMTAMDGAGATRVLSLFSVVPSTTGLLVQLDELGELVQMARWRYMWLHGFKPIIRRFAGIRDGEVRRTEPGYSQLLYVSFCLWLIICWPVDLFLMLLEMSPLVVLLDSHFTGWELEASLFPIK